MKAPKFSINHIRMLNTMSSPSITIPPTQRAIIAGQDGDFKISNDVLVAELEPHLILIKNVAVALNPVDTKLVGDFVRPGVMFGFDCAGFVVAVGSAVERDIKPGDRVCGSADGMNHNRPSGGAFAEYVTLHSQLALKIPESLSFEAAAALGTAIASSAMALFWSLQIPASLTTTPEEALHVLVYGGSSSTGTMVIQLIKAYVQSCSFCAMPKTDLSYKMWTDTHYDLLAQEF